MINIVARELLAEVEKDSGIKINAKTKRRVEKKMFKLFERSRKVQRSNRSNTVAFPEYDLIFREGALSKIKAIKGWKSDAEMARELGLSKAYICGLKKQKFGVTSTVISRIAVATGNIEKNWHIFYDLKFVGFKSSSDPKWNESKYKGEIPYGWASSVAKIRENDYEGSLLEREKPPYEKVFDNLA